jgi:hypothetical protein
MSEMPALEKVTVSEKNTNYMEYGGVVYRTSGYEWSPETPIVALVPEKLQGDVVIYDGVRELNGRKFIGRSGITSITLPESVQFISGYELSNCGALQKVVIKNPECVICDYPSDDNGRFPEYTASAINNEVITVTDEYGNTSEDYVYNGVIEAPAGSLAEKFAAQFGYKFQELGKDPVSETTTTTTASTTTTDTTTTTTAAPEPDKGTTTTQETTSADQTTTAGNTTTAVTTTASGTTTTVPGEPVTRENAKLGDVNLDGKVDATDASEILQVYARISTGEKPEEIGADLVAACDIDGDSKVDSADASAVLEYYAFIQTGGTGTLEEYLKKDEETDG